MKFSLAPLADAWVIDLEPTRDARGFFARTYCEKEFSQRGLNTSWLQISHSYSAVVGTLRGMHYQRDPYAEVKLVRCLRGKVHDVIVDLRPSSPTRHHWFGIELAADCPRWLYVPKGCAHGFLTLTNDVEMEYMVSAPHTPGAASGVRYNDPLFNIPWPREVEVISPRDAAWPDFRPADLSTGGRE
jgi:dTDP-4-dehydrorhamnose 3,5-epimerase